MQESQMMYSKETGLVKEVLGSEYLHPIFLHLQPENLGSEQVAPGSTPGPGRRSLYVLFCQAEVGWYIQDCPPLKRGQTASSPRAPPVPGDSSSQGCSAMCNRCSHDFPVQSARLHCACACGWSPRCQGAGQERRGIRVQIWPNQKQESRDSLDTPRGCH